MLKRCSVYDNRPVVVKPANIYFNLDLKLSKLATWNWGKQCAYTLVLDMEQESLNQGKLNETCYMKIVNNNKKVISS